MQSNMQVADRREDAEPALKIIIASEIRFLRESLVEILARNRAMLVIGYAYNSDQIVSLSSQLRPDMLLLDAAICNGIGRSADCERRWRGRASFSCYQRVGPIGGKLGRSWYRRLYSQQRGSS